MVVFQSVTTINDKTSNSAFMIDVLNVPIAIILVEYSHIVRS